MKTSFLSLAALVLLALASSCAEPVGVSGVPAAGKGGKTNTTGSGGTTATSTESGGTTSTTTTSTSTDSGGTTGTTTVTSSGGTTTTSTGSGGTTIILTGSGGTTTTTAAPVDCGTTSGELVIKNETRLGTTDIGDTITISAPDGASVPVADIIAKFCFGVLGTTTTPVSPSAITMDYAAVNVSVAPYNVTIGATMKVTTETTTDGGACVVFNVGTTSGVSSLTLAKPADVVTLQWRFVYGGLDRTKPAQVIALRGETAAACSGVTLTAGAASTATASTTTTGVGGKTSTTTATTGTAGAGA